MLQKLKVEVEEPGPGVEMRAPRRRWPDTLKKNLVRLWSWRWLVAALVAGIALTNYVIVPFVLGPRVAVNSVIRADLVQTVVASGHVEAPFRVNIGSQITGVVASVPVDEGQTVKAGDVLVVLDDREARAAVVQAESQVAQAEARLRQIKELTQPSAVESLKEAKATLLDAQAAYDRAAALAKSGYGTQASLDTATKARDVAAAQVRSAEFSVFTTAPGGSAYVMAETELNQARAGLVTAQARLSYTTIVAPRDGVLISRDVERGNVVQPSNVLMKLSPAGETQLVVQIDERNLGSLVLGQSAIGSADAFPKDKFAAAISYINPGVDLERASVEVKLRVPDPPKYLRQDMTVSVDIEVARRPNALIVAAADIRDVDSSEPWVLKAENQYAYRQPVKVGLVAAGKAEIVDGLSEGDLIIPVSAASIKEGARIRPEAAASRPAK